VVACATTASVVPIASVVVAFVQGALHDINYGNESQSLGFALYAIVVDYLFALPVWFILLLIQSLLWAPVLIVASYYGRIAKLAAVVSAPLAAVVLSRLGVIATHSHLARLTISGSPFGPLETEIAGMTVTAGLFMVARHFTDRLSAQ
jgi:hypothetical protein